MQDIITRSIVPPTPSQRYLRFLEKYHAAMSAGLLSSATLVKKPAISTVRFLRGAK